MKSLKLKLSLIILLAAVFLASAGVFFGLRFANADRSVPVTGSSIFFANGAEVWSHEVKGDTEENDAYYTMFVLDDGGDTINYRKNLAYTWFSNTAPAPAEGEKATLATTASPEHFSMEIGFERLDFKRFTITFESQQYYQTKDEKTANYIVFAPDGDASVKALILNELPDEEEGETLDAAYGALFDDSGEYILLGSDHIVIEFGDRVGDGYPVSVHNAGFPADSANTKTFKNVGGNYAKYSASSTTVTPLSFSAAFAGDEGTNGAYMALYSLNKQSFKLKTKPSANASGHFGSGDVNDDTPPVLCLDKGISYIEEGKEIGFNYTVIDVLAGSPTVETYYFMLTDGQAGSAFNATDYTDSSLFRKVENNDDQYMIPHKNHYAPAQGDCGSAFGDDFTAKAAVKVCLKLIDTATNDGQTTYVLLDWYVEPEYLVTVLGNKYIAVATDEVGAYYAYTDNATKTSSPDSDAWSGRDGLVQAYQKKVDEAVAEQNLKAGSMNYFYLPSAEELFSDTVTGNYSDLSFSIYYKTDSDSGSSGQSSTGKTASSLSLNLNKAGKYIFTIYVTDAAGNPMYYYNADNEAEEIKTGDIWNLYNERKDTEYEGMKKYLPWFEFEVKNPQIEIEDPGEQETAYVGTTYTSLAFEINGVSYDTSYTLYRFDNAEYYRTHHTALTYEDFLKQKDSLLDDCRECFTLIKASSTLDEENEEYDTFAGYEWNGTNSFIPQDNNAFYLIKCVAESSDNKNQNAVAYMAIVASPKMDELKGEDNWAQENMTSIILLSIAGVSLIGIILLLVIKPKNKGDIDEDFEAAKKSKKSKK